MKDRNGWSDEEMYDAYCYNVQVRYALGLRQLGEGNFDLRTVYYFRERVSRHMQENGENLLDKAFEQVTDEQIDFYDLKTGRQRTPAFPGTCARTSVQQVQVWTVGKLPAIFGLWAACSCWLKYCSECIAC
jgi:hypothetical protein